MFLGRGLRPRNAPEAVSQTEARVEHYHRNADGTWTLRDLRAGELVALTSLDITLPIDEVYAGVTFPPPRTRESDG